MSLLRPWWLAGLALLLIGCDDSGSSFSTTPPQPPGEPVDLLVYRSDADDPQLYRLDSRGTATRLSDADDTQGIDWSYAVSPDNRLAAFAYRLAGETAAPAIKRIADNTQEEPAPVATAGSLQVIQWLPGSRELIYTVRDSAADASSLFHAEVGDPEAVQLIGDSLGAQARLQVVPSADGRLLAVVAEYFASPVDFIPVSAALYLLDLRSAAEPLLVAATAGDANSFKIAWAPTTHQLAWQQRLVTEPFAPGIPTNYPAGALMLADGTGASQVLRNIDGDEGWIPWVWLDGARILVTDYRRGFELIATDGSLVTSHATAGNGGVTVSPDGRRLAFIALASGTGLAVHALALDSLEYRELGPASSYYVIGGVSDDSVLRWSPEGARLAWQREIDRPNRLGELYVHDFGTGGTRLVTGRLALYATYAENWFGWLPGGDQLDFVASTAGAFELTVARPAIGVAQVIGGLAATTCGVARAWHSDLEVLWDACGEGVRLSRRRQDGSFATTGVYERDVWRMALSADRAFGLMQDAQAGAAGDYPAADREATWQAYDFGAQRLQALDGTGGTLCCGTLLQ